MSVDVFARRQEYADELTRALGWEPGGVPLRFQQAVGDYATQATAGEGALWGVRAQRAYDMIQPRLDRREAAGTLGMPVDGQRGDDQPGGTLLLLAGLAALAVVVFS